MQPSIGAEPFSMTETDRNIWLRRLRLIANPFGGTAGSAVPSCVFGVRNLRGMAKGEQDARRGSVFDV
jgi:hypothetical protein